MWRSLKARQAWKFRGDCPKYVPKFGTRFCCIPLCRFFFETVWWQAVQCCRSCFEWDREANRFREKAGIGMTGRGKVGAAFPEERKWFFKP